MVQLPPPTISTQVFPWGAFMGDVGAWLKTLGLSDYASTFVDSDVDFDVLPHLTEQDLKDMGFSLGHRRKLLAAISELQENDQDSVPKSEREQISASTPTEAERRQITVLFCDLVGSTELSQRLDPEDLRDVISRYQDAVSGSVTRYEGYVARFVGDGVLAYFGWPRAYEDQAERAVRAALDALAAIGRLKMDQDQFMRARVGIGTGQVVIGDIVGDVSTELGAVVGETPNLAARLQGLAEPDTVIIDEATRQLVGHVFELEDQGSLSLKGFAEPVTAWRVSGERTVESRFEAAHGTTLTQFVGRKQETALLLDRWAQAKDGEGQVVLLSGEAGIGKSRILRQLSDHLREEPHITLRYQCSPHHVNAAFYPIIEQLQQAADFKLEDTANGKLDRLEQLLGTTIDESSEFAPLMAAMLSLPTERYPALDMTPQKQKLQTIAVLAAYLAERARQQPVLMLVEDVHWIDPSTLDMLDAVVEGIQVLNVLMVVTHRPEIEPRWTGYGHVTHHSLNRLSRVDGRAIAERITGGKALPEEVLGQILEQTDGVPLFVEELTKSVLEAGFLEEADGRYVLAGPLPALAIPTTLQGSLMARLDRLAPVKEVVQAAACIGREFSPSLLAVVISMAETTLTEALSQLVEAQLIFRRSSLEGTTYIFKHALVQDAAYESLLKSKRQQLHAKLAQALEGLDGPDPLILARHFSAAGLAEKASIFYLAAGQRLLGTSALPEASGALELGLQQVGVIAASAERDRLELDLRVALGTARMAQLGWPHPSVSEALEPAYTLARKLKDQDALGPILWGLWVHYQTRTEFPRAHEWLENLDDVAEESDGSELSIVRDMSRGCQYFWQAEYDRAAKYTDYMRATYDEAEHARIVGYANHDPLCFSLHWAGSLLDWITGYPDRSLARLDEALSVARRLKHPFNLAFSLTGGSQSLISRGDADRMLAHCDEAQAAIDDAGLGEFAENAMVRHWRGQALILRKEFTTGYDVLRQGNDFWNATGGRICNAMWWCLMSIALEGMNRRAEALELIDRAILHCRETGDRYMEPECLRIKGEFLLGDDEPDYAAAEEIFGQSIKTAQAHKAKSWELRTATSMAKLWRSQGNDNKSREQLTPIYDWFTEGFDTCDLREAKALLDEVN